MSDFPKTLRNRVVRLPNRGHYDKETIYRIVDDALICHVGIVQEQQPFVIPTLHARQGDNLLLHGATTSRLLKYVQAGHEICITITLVDGLVLARSVFHHSINYRSVVLFGRGNLLPEADKVRALQLFTERIMPGRWDDARQPTANELKATTVVSVPIDSASAKVRVGPPSDDEEDYALPVWAGVVPLRQQVGAPIDDERLADGIAVPAYIHDYVAHANQSMEESA